jgi:Golgi phosphoprotein 3 (GPP34)
MALIAEDLLLLLLHDVSGKNTIDATRLDYALGGAVLLELAMAGRVDVTEKRGWLGRTRVVVDDATPTGDRVLDDALTLLRTGKPRDLQSAVTSLSKKLRAALLGRLAEHGVLRREQDRVLGVFPRERWSVLDATHERALRGRLHDVLVVGLTSDRRTSALIPLLSAIDQAHKVIDAPDRKAVKARARTIGAGDWAGDAVRKAVQAAQAAVAATVVAASVASSTGGS